MPQDTERPCPKDPVENSTPGIPLWETWPENIEPSE